MSALPLKLIVGLGNPDAEHARTRHNAGFWFVDELARRHGGSFRYEARYQGEVARVRIGDEDVWLFKPMTYMNNSGGPSRSFANFYKVPVEALLVAYDELDFDPGTIRLKKGGGAGGHNGMRDMIAQFGDGFWRMRIGIGHPGHRDAVLHYVLGRPSSADLQLIQENIAEGCDVVPVMIADGPEKAMNRLHTRGGTSAP
ncbi:MAG TPA: aminoacyl-tRNA hydrolase [Steroidobacteraceae bacterium]|jgi:PTH1 family peptidyl-tRNA hydrolase